jgi:alpha-methylacyl-CoA racemase
MNERRGPLVGLRVVEFVSVGPGPHCAMLLADLGAEVVRIDRPGGNGLSNPVMDRGRSAITVDIRSDAGRDYCRVAASCADVLIEGMRPGVMERLGLGPEPLMGCNPRLIYARMTGWGQDGPLAQAAGHDINYIALSGALAGIGAPGGNSVPPLNFVGDFGGGSLYLAVGILAALLERERSGRGQIVDAAIIDGVSSMMTMFAGGLSLDRSRNVLSGSAPFYRCYFCKDGREISIGALEPAFYAQLIERIGAPREFLEGQNDTTTWTHRSAVLASLFASRTFDEWCALLEGSDVCFAPVLDLEQAMEHPHMRARGTYVEAFGRKQPAPAPRFSRTPGAARPSTLDGAEVLARWQVEL